jgi:hypothetical protein
MESGTQPGSRKGTPGRQSIPGVTDPVDNSRHQTPGRSTSQPRAEGASKSTQHILGPTTPKGDFSHKSSKGSPARESALGEDEKQRRARRLRANQLRLERYGRIVYAYQNAPGSHTRRLARGVDSDGTAVDIGPRPDSNNLIGAFHPGAIGSSTRRMIDEDDSSDEDAEGPYYTNEGIELGNYDVTPEKRVIGAVSMDDVTLWTRPAAEFIRSHSGITTSPDVWVGRYPLGKGGFGMAGLWEKIDPEGNVVDVSVWLWGWVNHS